MNRAELRKESPAFKIGWREGNNWRANMWPHLPGADVCKVAIEFSSMAMDSADSKLDYQRGFRRACGDKS